MTPDRDINRLPGEFQDAGLELNPPPLADHRPFKVADIMWLFQSDLTFFKTTTIQQAC